MYPNEASSPVLTHLLPMPESNAVLIKDSIDIQGLPTRLGSRAMAGAAPALRDADAVALMRNAGWTIAGKAKMHELAFGTTGINLHDGTPLNPRWPALVPGGSSSGSAAAVALGLVVLALGTDTGGSVRVPAACCGVYGIKPSFGLVSRRGVAPQVSSLDCVGLLGRDMDVVVQGMRALVAGFEMPPLPSTLRITVLDVDADLNVATRVQQALDAWAAQDTVSFKHISSLHFDAAYLAGLSIINAEAWQACQHLVESGLLGADVLHRLRLASATTPSELVEAEQVRTAFTEEVDALLARCDVLALPTMASLPPRVEDAFDTTAAVGMTRLVRPFNLSGHPAVSIPLAAAEDGPVALQLVARRGADAWLCAIAQRCAAVCSPHHS